jgi:hypothetical protein
MAIEAEHVESWIGAEVLDASGEKLGKAAEIYFRGSEPLVVGVKSGLTGRKHRFAPLRDAKVTRDSLRVAVGADAVAPGDGNGPGDEQLAALAAHDDRLQGLPPAELEGYGARAARLKAAAEAAAKAEELEAEARRRAEEEQRAAAQASDAGDAAQTARRKREEAEAKAKAAREEAAAKRP